MSKLLSVVIAAAFAATTVTAFAQATKDVKAKDGNVKSPDGKAVVTKDAKEAPKAAAPLPAVTPKAKEPVKAGEVKTKDGAAVKGGDKKDVKTETKTK
jgi:Ni/Co efflux regulator RcnB